MVVCVDEILVIRNWPVQDHFETFIKKQTLAGFAWKGSFTGHWPSHNTFALGCKHVAIVIFILPLMLMQLNINDFFLVLAAEFTK
jgi:hypothetical protein